MKTKITFISVVTLSIALLLTSCSGKGTVSTTEPQNTTAEDSTASIYIFRRTRSLQCIKIYGTNYLV